MQIIEVMLIVLAVIFFVIIRQFLLIKENNVLVEKYRYLAYHDPLTGLYNRASFREDLNREMLRAKKRPSKIGLMLLDLDGFKQINDTMGHNMGDRLLKAFSGQLQQVAKDQDRIYRLGGDEFVIILLETEPAECKVLAEKIIEELVVPFQIEKRDMGITTSIGISMYPDHGENTDELFQKADLAMYRAKGIGKNGFQFYGGGKLYRLG